MDPADATGDGQGSTRHRNGSLQGPPPPPVGPPCCRGTSPPNCPGWPCPDWSPPPPPSASPCCCPASVPPCPMPPNCPVPPCSPQPWPPQPPPGPGPGPPFEGSEDRGRAWFFMPSYTGSASGGSGEKAVKPDLAGYWSIDDNPIVPLPPAKPCSFPPCPIHPPMPVPNASLIFIEAVNPPPVRCHDP
jgi:hypothetical protein